MQGHNRVVARMHYPGDVEAARISGSVIDNVLPHRQRPPCLAPGARHRARHRDAPGRAEGIGGTETNPAFPPSPGDWPGKSSFLASQGIRILWPLGRSSGHRPQALTAAGINVTPIPQNLRLFPAVASKRNRRTSPIRDTPFPEKALFPSKYVDEAAFLWIVHFRHSLPSRS
jgi:hypothetical protein